MAAKAGRLADIYIASGPGAGSAFTGEACTVVAGTGNTVYEISNANKSRWSTATPVVPLVDGLAPTVPYQIGYGGGIIVFREGVVGTVTVSGAYLAVSKLGEGREWSLDVSIKTRESTVFGDTWETHVVTMRGASGTFGRFWLDDYFLDEISNPLIIVLYEDYAAGVRIEGMGHLTSDAVKNAAGDLVMENVGFIIDGPIHYQPS